MRFTASRARSQTSSRSRLRALLGRTGRPQTRKWSGIMPMFRTADLAPCSTSSGLVGITMRSAYWCGANRRRTPASMARRRSLARTAVADHARPRVGPPITQNSGPDGSAIRSAVDSASTDHAQGIHPHLATAIALAVADEETASPPVEVGLGERERLVDPKARSPQHHDQPAHPPAVTIVSGLPHDRDDLIDRGRIRRIPTPWSAGSGRRNDRASLPASAGGRRRPTTAEQTWLPPLESGLVCRLL